MFTAGILEEMFSGYGFEYLYFDSDKPWAAGFEIFDVTKRDYELQFGLSDYQNTVANANFYYRNYDFIPFDAKISAGEYLAGDKGITFELSRSYLNGMQFGVLQHLQTSLVKNLVKEALTREYSSIYQSIKILHHILGAH